MVLEGENETERALSRKASALAATNLCAGAYRSEILQGAGVVFDPCGYCMHVPCAPESIEATSCHELLRRIPCPQKHSQSVKILQLLQDIRDAAHDVMAHARLGVVSGRWAN